jgi:prolyl oligopeptidase
MKFFSQLILLFSLSIGSLFAQINYKIDTTIYHDIKVIDKYRWLENLRDPVVNRWLIQKNVQFDSFLLSKKNEQEKIKKVIDKFSTPSNINFRGVSQYDSIFLYIRKNPSLGSELLVRKTNNIEDTVFYLTDTLHKYSIASYQINKKFNKILVCYFVDGSEIGSIIVLDSRTKKIIDSSVNHVMSLHPVSWMPGKNEFIYTRVSEKENGELAPSPFLDNAVYKHLVGSKYKNDDLLLSRKNNPNLSLSEIDIPAIVFKPNSTLAIAYAQRANAMLTFFGYGSLNGIENKAIDWKSLYYTKDSIFAFSINKNEVFLLQKKRDSSFVSKIIVTPDKKHTTQHVLSYGKIINDIYCKKNSLILIENEGPSSIIEEFDLSSRKVKKITLPKLGTLTDYPTDIDDEFFFKFQSWTDIPIYYSYNVSTGLLKQKIAATQKMPNIKNIVSELLYVTSRDGVSIPLTLIHKEGIVLNGSSSVIMEAYGSFGVSYQPSYAIDRMALIDLGFICAIAHVRGGGELGESWHLAGVKENKHNTSNDVIDCAKYLIEKRYTSKGRIGLLGSSAAGVTIGMAMVKEPSLFGAVCIRSGYLNTILGEQTSNTQAALVDWGSVKNKTEFISIYNNDVYHSINPSINYPPVLITTGFNDPRVAPWMSAKFFIKLQEDNKNLGSYLKVSNNKHSYLDPLEELIFFTENIK